MKDFLSAAQYYAAPVLAPIPTAVAIGATLAHSLSTIPGIDPNLVTAGAWGGAIAAELSGGMMFSGAALAFARRKWGALGVALTGAACYAGFVIYGLYSGQDSRIMISSVLVTLIAYTGKALWDYLRADKTEQAQAVAVNQSAAETALRLEQERTKQARAAVQIAKAGASAGVQPVSSVSSGQMDGYHFDAEIMTRIRAYLAEHPGASVREVGAAGLGVKKSAAAAYMAEIERRG